MLYMSAAYWLPPLLIFVGVVAGLTLADVGIHLWTKKKEKTAHGGQPENLPLPARSLPPGMAWFCRVFRPERRVPDKLRAHQTKAMGGSSKWVSAKRALEDAAKDSQASIRFWNARIEKAPEDEKAESQVKSAMRLLKSAEAALDVVSMRTSALGRFYSKADGRSYIVKASALKAALRAFDATEDRILPEKMLREYVGVLAERLVEARPEETEALRKLEKNLYYD